MLNTATVTCSPTGFPNVYEAADSHSTNLFQPSITLDKTGTEDADTVTGSDGSDTLQGLGGHDVIDGAFGGNDLGSGGDGNDRLFGFSGNDTLDGGLGNDTMIGGGGRDTNRMEVATGMSDVVLAVGVDKHGDGRRAANKDGLERLSETATIPAAKFAMMARTYLRERGASVEEMANVAVKNHGNAARNPFAQFRKPRTLEQVLASPRVVGDLTVQQCCPRGEGAAAVMVVSGNAIRKLGLDARRCVRVKASVAGSERPEAQYGDSAVELVRTSAQAAFDQAGIAPKELDLLELHDAFSVEELLYSEAIGVCDSGEGAR